MTQAAMSHKLLGEILVEEGALTPKQLEEALARQAKSGQFLGQILVEMGVFTHQALTGFLAKHCRIPYLSLLNYLMDKTLLAIVPKELCLKHSLLPIDRMGNNLTIAIVNPLNKEAIDEVKAACPNLRIKPVVCDWDHFKAVAAELFKEAESPAPDEEEERPLEAATTESEPETRGETETCETKADDEDAQSLAETMALLNDETVFNTYELLSRKVPLFGGLAPQAVAAVFTSGMTKEFAEGETIFEKGDISTELYVILGGNVVLRDGPTEVARLASGEMFGEMALVNGQPRTATAVALETTSAFVLSESTFQKLMTKQVALRLLLNMLGTMGNRLQSANEKLRAYAQR